MLRFLMLVATKRTIVIVLEIMIFWFINFIASIKQPFNLKQRVPFYNTRIRWDGILCMVAVYFVILMKGFIRKRLPAAAIESTTALVLAILIGYWGGYDSAAPFGF